MKKGKLTEDLLSEIQSIVSQRSPKSTRGVSGENERYTLKLKNPVRMSRIVEETESPKAKSKTKNGGTRSRPKSAIASVKLSKQGLNRTSKEGMDDIFLNASNEFATIDKNGLDKKLRQKSRMQSAVKSKERQIDKEEDI